jgi:hypothetical protein
MGRVTALLFLFSQVEDNFIDIKSHPLGGWL